MRGLPFLLGLLLFWGVALGQSQLAARQVVWPVESTRAFLNGVAVELAAPARLVEGRAMLPLRETARLLGVGLEPVPGTPDGLRLGGLEVYPGLRLARLDGRQVSLKEVGCVLDGTLYVAARALGGSLGAQVSYDPAQRVVLMRLAPVVPGGSRLPVARFTTDKLEYRLGEPVLVSEFSYDPDGLPLALKWTGREEAYFAPGVYTIGLTATNALGRVSEPYTVQIRVLDQPYLSPKDYALRYLGVGRTFPDGQILSYPVAAPERRDEPYTLLFSDSPEKVPSSGLLYEDSVQGAGRLLLYHVNGTPGPARVLVLASSLSGEPQTLRVQRLGSVANTRIESVLGQVSLLEFLASRVPQSLALEPRQALPLYLSPPLAPGEGVSLKADLEIVAPLGRAPEPVLLSVYLLETRLMGDAPDFASPDFLGLLRSLPALEPDSNHVRGTFPSALRRLRLDLGGLEPGGALRLVIGDGRLDPSAEGFDAMSRVAVRLAGNYGLTYRITLDNAAGTVGAFSPRGGPYSGVIAVGGRYVQLPQSGVLLRNDLPLIFYRNLDGPGLSQTLELEFVPASGSFLPVNLVFYRPGALPEELAADRPDARSPATRSLRRP
ncbi:copper amine oxidase N-terminal domain-containing protein [Calidithermus chliarophilus]|uniref:copper amine oxidase N-terminal domain-containing protein n=1 Tax=Calidithermus chliarophilus TaxID=52023 RepID=UPI0004024402|nr:copper amine oxidase N-terminal domain-containing protein [Calidithermus chliarophilus]